MQNRKSRAQRKKERIKFLMLDFFCGGGGTTLAAKASGVCKVIVAINHDDLCIETHAKNNKGILHITEDILVAKTAEIKLVIECWKKIYPHAKVVLWASLECTNHSDAKGGLPRDADSRALADAMPRYLIDLPIDIFLIENVKEFMAWGPVKPKVVNKAGKHYCPLYYKNGVPGPHMIPESRSAGKDYIRWVKDVQKLGYEYDYRMLLAANFGGVTIRERYFGAFWKPGINFAWPQPTHAKKVVKGTIFENPLKPWRAVKEVLDFSDLGESIFTRKKPLVDKTLIRILAGLKKFHTQPQIMVCNSPGYCQTVDQPIGAITTVNSKALITPFVYQYNGQSIGRSVQDPSAVVTTEQKLYLASFLTYYNGNGGSSSLDKPSPTVLTHDRISLITPWIDRQFGSGRFHDISQPAGALLTVPKMSLCSAFLVNPQYTNDGSSINMPAPTVVASRRALYLASAFIVNPQYSSNGSSVNAPAPTVIAQQRSFPLSLAVPVYTGSPNWIVSDTDSVAMKNLKDFMREKLIDDVLMRMLFVDELKQIQGFPKKYILLGAKDKQKKMIGNSVEKNTVVAWMRAMAAVQAF